MKYPGIPAWMLAVGISILLHVVFLIHVHSPAGFEPRAGFHETILMSQRWDVVSAPSPEPKLHTSAESTYAGVNLLEPKERHVSLPSERPVLATSGDIESTVTKSYLKLNEVQTPAGPQVGWLLPFKHNYFAGVRRLEFQIWIDVDGAVPGVQLLAVGPVALSQSELQVVVDWIRNTAMSPAFNDGSPVASTRVIEIVLDSSVE